MKALVDKKFLEYSKRSYVDLKKLIDSPECYKEVLEGKPYRFEITAKIDKSDLVEVMILCERDRPLFFRGLGAAKYFSISPAGIITENTEAW